MNDEQLTNALSEIDELCAEHDSIADQLATVTADRDVKATNLQLLVDKVLAYTEAFGDDDVPGPLAEEAQVWWDAVEAAETEMIELARGLKQ